MRRAAAGGRNTDIIRLESDNRKIIQDATLQWTELKAQHDQDRRKVPLLAQDA